MTAATVGNLNTVSAHDCTSHECSIDHGARFMSLVSAGCHVPTSRSSCQFLTRPDTKIATQLQLQLDLWNQS